MINVLNKEPLNKFIIRLAHPFRIKWDLFVMILATWNVFSIPFIVAFIPKFDESISLQVFNLLIDFLFFIDIVLNFRTTFFNTRTGDEISEPRLIAKNYFVSRKFTIDVLASCPFDVLTTIFVQENSGRPS